MTTTWTPLDRRTGPRDPGFGYTAYCFDCTRTLYDEQTHKPLTVAKAAHRQGVCHECAWDHDVNVTFIRAVGITRDKIPASVTA